MSWVLWFFDLFFSSSIQLFSWSLYTHIHMHLHYSKSLMSVEGVNLHENVFYMLKWCSWSRRMRNQDAGSTLGFFGTQGAGFTIGTRWGKKHTPYIKILLWLQAHMLNLKLFSPWKKGRSRKIKTKTHHLKPTLTYIFTHVLSHIDALIPIYHSKPPPKYYPHHCYTSTYASTVPYTHFICHQHIYM